MMSLSSSLRTRAPRIALRQQKRNLHVRPAAVGDLLGKYLPSGVGASPASSDKASCGEGWQGTPLTPQPGIPFKLWASRGINAPVFEAGEATLPLDLLDGALPAGTDKWLADLGVGKADVARAKEALAGVWSAWRDNDLLRVEGVLHAGNTSLSSVQILADDFALPRQPHLASLADAGRIHPLEAQAAAGKLFYHKSRAGGNIGCYGYGAGIALATQDVLVAEGGKPANFLDGGGGATEANVQAAMNVVLADPDVDVFFINSFGGLTKMDLIATGVVSNLRARKEKGETIPPIVARLRGTGEEEAREILAAATDLADTITYIGDMKTAAAEAVRLANKAQAGKPAKAAPAPAPSTSRNPVVFSQDGQYEQTLRNLVVEKGDTVMVLGMGKAVSPGSRLGQTVAQPVRERLVLTSPQSQANCAVAKEYGTNIIGAVAPNKGGQEFLGTPTFGSVKEGVAALKPRIASVFVPPQAAADSIIECIEAEIPLIVAYAEGVPTHEQLKVQRALRSQSKSRLVGANCPGVIFPHQRVKLGIQPLRVHSPGSIGIVSRSGTVSYELAGATTALGLGQSAVYGLGGDPFPGTRTWEALQLMLEDPYTKVICLVGEIGGQMEEEAAAVYKAYVAGLAPGAKPKPVVGFVAGAATQQGLMYGHAGAIWWSPDETANAKRQVLADAGMIMAPTLGDIGGLLKREHDKLSA
ncbi:Succinate--CoA ligase [ADP-forming] subunit alpha, mitochondrial [Vanrija pseudolonga]|uniref:Succinate--CoA ligase [ADP-forming] subunit alpha, mitochondrial n=1 Tax=Vanrija pseudolonga TaxID=143232 RepID=A0AAF0YEM9_9TREE|nr:Succinate--CoA ligase [ADP-forming] subunit alpha, mitochondrial [Vanrija pseudolonga]